MKKWLFVVVLLLGASGCGGGGKAGKTVTVAKTVTTSTATTTTAQQPTESAGVFLKRILLEEGRGQYGREYDSLHPGQQKFVSKTLFIACEQELVSSSTSQPIAAVKIDEIYEEPIDVPGVTSKPLPAKAVTMTLTGSSGATSTRTQHAISVDGQWRWILPQRNASQFVKDNGCPNAVSGAGNESSVPALANAPKKPGEIIIKGKGQGQLFGPFNFQPGGYTFRFAQYDPTGQVTDFARDASSFVVSLDSKPNDVTQPYQLLANVTANTGSNQVVVSGKLYVEVSSADASYMLRFTPK
jgi:hypothetical protein